MSVKFTDAKEFEFVFRNNGIAPEEIEKLNDGKSTEDIKRVEMTDALSSPDAPFFFKVTVENIVREAVEPLLIGSKLLTRINYKVGQMITLPSVGAMYAADIDEGAEYPERSLNFGPGIKIATIGKSGLAVKFTEEMKRYSQYDIVAMHLKAAGLALARHKEQKIWNMLSRMGTVSHDNVTPAQSVFGVTTGRSISGAGNGSITVENIFEAYGQMMLNGFIPNAIIVHPLTFTMFAIDPVLRTFALNFGGGSWFSGKPGILNKDPHSNGALGNLGPQGQSGTHPGALFGNFSPNISLNQGITEGVKLPNYLGLPLQVIVSPFVPYNPATRLTDIYLVDTNNIGCMIVDEEATTESIQDRLRDLEKIKIRERYAIAPLADGKGVMVMKNVKVTHNEIVTPVMGVGNVISAIAREAGILDPNGLIIPPQP